MNIFEDDGQSFSDVLDYTYLMSWPVTSRPWAICNEEEQNRVVKKHLHRNYLQSLSPTKQIYGSMFVPVCIVDAMKIVRSMPITKLKPPISLTNDSNNSTEKRNLLYAIGRVLAHFALGER